MQWYTVMRYVSNYSDYFQCGGYFNGDRCWILVYCEVCLFPFCSEDLFLGCGSLLTPSRTSLIQRIDVLYIWELSEISHFMVFFLVAQFAVMAIKITPLHKGNGEPNTLFTYRLMWGLRAPQGQNKQFAIMEKGFCLFGIAYILSW